MGHRRDIGYSRHLHPSCLQSADRRVSPAARAFNEHPNLAHSHIHSLAGRFFGGHLGSVRRALARSFEPNTAAARPAHSVALRVRNGDYRVVESRLYMGLTFGHYSGIAPALTSFCQVCPPRSRFYRLMILFLMPMERLWPRRVRAFVCVRWPRTGRFSRCRIPR